MILLRQHGQMYNRWFLVDYFNMSVPEGFMSQKVKGVVNC